MRDNNKIAIEEIPADAVIQALKCCTSSEYNCHHCPFKGVGTISDSCISAMSRSALDLIYRKQSEWISVEERLPNDLEWVQVYDGNRRYKILRFEKGIDEDTREKMRTGEIPDPETTGWTKTDGFFMIKRSEQFKAADVFGNNMVPYCWRTEYGDTIFGQNITWWRNLPEPPKGEKHES